MFFLHREPAISTGSGYGHSDGAYGVSRQWQAPIFNGGVDYEREALHFLPDGRARLAARNALVAICGEMPRLERREGECTEVRLKGREALADIRGGLLLWRNLGDVPIDQFADRDAFGRTAINEDAAVNLVLDLRRPSLRLVPGGERVELSGVTFPANYGLPAAIRTDEVMPRLHLQCAESVSKPGTAADRETVSR